MEKAFGIPFGLVWSNGTIFGAKIDPRVVLEILETRPASLGGNDSTSCGAFGNFEIWDGVGILSCYYNNHAILIVAN